MASSSAEWFAEPAEARLHVEGHLRHGLGVVGSRLGQTGHDHVGITDGLDLLEAVALRQVVEGAEDLVEDIDDALGRRALGERREVDDIGEEDRDLLVGLGDAFLVALQPLGDRPRAAR